MGLSNCHKTRTNGFVQRRGVVTFHVGSAVQRHPVIPAVTSPWPASWGMYKHVHVCFPHGTQGLWWSPWSEPRLSLHLALAPSPNSHPETGPVLRTEFSLVFYLLGWGEGKG